MAVTGDTQLGPTKAELISEVAQRALISQSILAGTVRDVSQFARKGYNQISFPKGSTAFTVENRASAAPGTVQDVDFLKDTLDLDFRAHIEWIIDSNDEIESSLDVMRTYIERAAARHGAYVDQQLVTEMEASAITTTTAGALNQSVVLEMRQILLRNKANPRSLFLAVAPENEAELLAVDPFVSAEKYGRGIIADGVLGTLYGVQVVMTPELAANQYFMYESEGVALGFQRRPQFDEEKAISYGTGAMRQVLDQKFGVQSLFLGAPGAFQADGTTPVGAAESGLIVKDNNV